MAVHELKCLPQYFSEVKSGKKKFEVRFNDRNYQVGDVLILMEYSNGDNKFSGRSLYRLVDYILDSSFNGLAPNYVVMSLSNFSKKRLSLP